MADQQTARAEEVCKAEQEETLADGQVEPVVRENMERAREFCERSCSLRMQWRREGRDEGGSCPGRKNFRSHRRRKKG